MYDYDIDNDPGNTYLGLSAKQWRGIFKFCGGIFVFIFTLAIIIYVYFGSTEHISVVYIENNKPALFTTEKEFLSFALDTSLIARGLDLYNFTSPKFIKMLKHLEPAYFRIGGTEQDRLHFNPHKVPLNLQEYEVQQDGDHCAYDEAMCIIHVASRPNFTMTGSDWLLINNIARKANLKLIFGLNSLIRKTDGSWDSKNAQKLILFSKNNRFNVNWELGNEPNAFYHQFFYSVNATQMAKDFAKLKNILNGYKMYKKSLLLGPDVTRPRKNHQESMKYLNEFLGNKDSDVVDAITWHQYYLDGHNANPNEFLDTEILDLLSEEIDTIKKIREDSGVEHKQIWLGETSSAYGGGASGMSDKYIALFMWADKLGISAKKGISVVIRQSIFEGHYALLDDDFDPNPVKLVFFFYFPKKMASIGSNKPIRALLLTFNDF
ncbi:unnamed protein product [Brassicogethes aeneus]|uniref:Uncharacterized protein n=1 Tax=Brassicogethes aeneus TaxID=1431903 RepID=A0A9P0BFB7_BRAAE|nr:unnamed protein product [Brassicogethes aeneus]